MEAYAVTVDLIYDYVDEILSFFKPLLIILLCQKDTPAFISKQVVQ